MQDFVKQFFFGIETFFQGGESPPISELFEHFVVIGLPPDTDINPTIDFFKSLNHNERISMAKDRFSSKSHYKGSPGPTYDPKVMRNCLISASTNSDLNELVNNF